MYVAMSTQRELQTEGACMLRVHTEGVWVLQCPHRGSVNVPSPHRGSVSVAMSTQRERKCCYVHLQTVWCRWCHLWGVTNIAMSTHRRRESCCYSHKGGNVVDVPQRRRECCCPHVSQITFNWRWCNPLHFKTLSELNDLLFSWYKRKIESPDTVQSDTDFDSLKSEFFCSEFFKRRTWTQILAGHIPMWKGFLYHTSSLAIFSKHNSSQCLLLSLVDSSFLCWAASWLRKGFCGRTAPVNTLVPRLTLSRMCV